MFKTCCCCVPSVVQNVHKGAAKRPRDVGASGATVITTCMETTMKKVHASKKTGQQKQKTTVEVIPECCFCGSRRIGFDYGDDDGSYVAVRCEACGAQGPMAEARIGGWTHEMVRECANAWNMIWNNFTNPPTPVLVDLVGEEEVWHREIRSAMSAPPVRTAAPSRKQVDEHAVHVAAPPTGTNGVNGHNGHHNGSVL
jgi:hypothetical protein